MNDNDIIKALNHCCGNDKHDDKCTEEKCYQVVLPEMRDGDLRWCRQWLIKDALELIKRQQAEIERLKMDNVQLKNDIAEYIMDDGYMTELCNNAIKEFAQRLKYMHNHNKTSVVSLVTVFDNINSLAKEMTEKGGEG